MICQVCGCKLETPALRCPRCTAALPLGCAGSCKECASKKASC